MAVLFEQDVLEIYSRWDADSPEMRLRKEKRLLGALNAPKRIDQFVVKYSDGKFYSVSSRSPVTVGPSEGANTKGQPVLSKFGVRCDIEGFATLEQATLWWATCGE